MADVTPSALANSVMGKLYDVLTNGDATVPKSENSFFSWETPGVPVTPDDFKFLTQGFTGVVTPQAAKTLLAATAPQPTPELVGAGAPAAAPAAAPAPQGLTPAQLDQLRAQDVAGLFQQAEGFARLVDFVPDVLNIDNKLAPKVVQNDEGGLADVYEFTLKMSQVAQSQIPPDVQAKIDHFRTLLTATTEKTDLITGDKVQVSGPSPLVIAYNEKMTAFDNAALEYNNSRIDAMNADNPRAVQAFAINAPILRNKVKAAMDDWIGAGYKNQYEEINAFVEQVEQRDMSLLKRAYMDDLEKARLTGIASGSDFFYTALTPADFAESPGWSRFHFSSGDFSRYANSSFSASGWSAQASGSFLGIWHASGGASHEESRQAYDSHFDSSHFRLEFDICQVSIVRPWFKTPFVNSKAWRFDPGNPDAKSQMLSDGASPPKGLMPAYPTSVILIRNLFLDFGDNHGFQNFMAEQNSSSQGGSAGFGFGPFSIGASASHFSRSGSSQSSSGYSWNDQGLTVPGMQIVGYKCHVLPKSPDPASSITAWI